MCKKQKLSIKLLHNAKLPSDMFKKCLKRRGYASRLDDTWHSTPRTLHKC